METRICKTCERELPLTSFPLRAGRAGIKIYRAYRCSTCIHRRWKENNPSARNKIRQTARQCKQKYRSNKYQTKQRLLEEIGQTSCQRCGYNDIRALSFHHKDPTEKFFGIAWAFTHSYGFEKILSEAKKCEVLCENCHALHHFVGVTRAQHRRMLNKHWLMKEIKQEQCRDCGCRHPVCLTFHHRDPSSKEFKICQWLGCTKRLTRALEEAVKCDILCRNCHFIHHESEKSETQVYIKPSENRWPFDCLNPLPPLPPKPVSTHKICKTCKVEKPVQDFPMRRGEKRKDGTYKDAVYPRSQCKDCGRSKPTSCPSYPQAA